MKLVLEYKMEDIVGRAALNIPDPILSGKEYERRMLMFLETLDLLNRNLRKNNAVVQRRIEV